MGSPDSAEAQLPRASDQVARRLQSALVLSCLLHVLAYAHYRSADPDGIRSGDADSRRAALRISLAAPSADERSETSRSRALTKRRAPSHSEAGVTHRRISQEPGKPVAVPPEHRAVSDTDERYYTRDMLERSAQPTLDFRLPSALLSSLRSRLLLELWIDKAGKVREVELIEPVEVSEASQELIRNVEAIRFTPASRDGRFVNSRKLIELAVDGA